MNSVTAPVGVILPIAPLPPAASVNQRLPSGPVTMPRGLLAVRPPYSVIVPSGVMLPMRSLAFSVNQTAPSGRRSPPSGPRPS